jgi:hypothetical protein
VECHHSSTLLSFLWNHITGGSVCQHADSYSSCNRQADVAPAAGPVRAAWNSSPPLSRRQPLSSLACSRTTGAHTHRGGVVGCYTHTHTHTGCHPLLLPTEHTLSTHNSSRDQSPRSPAQRASPPLPLSRQDQPRGSAGDPLPTAPSHPHPNPLQPEHIRAVQFIW